MTRYCALEIPKFYQKTFRNDVSNVEGYGINFYLTFLYTNSKHTEKGIPFTIALNKINFLEINLAKEVRDLYNKNITPSPK